MSAAPGRRGRILILGLPYFGRMLAGLLAERGWRASYADHPGRSAPGWARLAPRVARADIVYLIGSRMDRRAPQDMLLRIRRKPVVIHWVGTDVQFAREEYDRRNLSARVAELPVHWCDAPWLVDELREMGVRSEYVPLPVPNLPAEPPPLPERFRALLYFPVDPIDREVFDMETLLRLPQALPNIDFRLIPSPPETLPGPLPPNLTATAWVEDMDALYREISVVVRLTSHDGMSFMAIEALARGRQVIWTHPLEGAIHAAGFDAVSAALSGLATRHAGGTLTLNEAGRTHVLTHFDPETLTSALDARLQQLLASADSR